MIKRFITWVKGFWIKSTDISDDDRSEYQIDMFIERLKKNAFHERKTGISVTETVLLNNAAISLKHNTPIPEFKSSSQKIADEFDQITWGSLTDDAKQKCISIARLDLAKQSHIITKLNESL